MASRFRLDIIDHRQLCAEVKGHMTIHGHIYKQKRVWFKVWASWQHSDAFQRRKIRKRSASLSACRSMSFCHLHTWRKKGWYINWHPVLCWIYSRAISCNLTNSLKSFFPFRTSWTQTRDDLLPHISDLRGSNVFVLQFYNSKAPNGIKVSSGAHEIHRATLLRELGECVPPETTSYHLIQYISF